MIRGAWYVRLTRVSFVMVGGRFFGIELAYVRCTCSGRRFVPYIPNTSKYLNTRFPNICCLVLYIC